MTNSIRLARPPTRLDDGLGMLRVAFFAVVLGSAAACTTAPANEVAAPESAFRAFREALQRADRQAAWTFLGPRTQAALQARFEEANRAGFALQSPADLLVVSFVPRAVDLQRIERAEQGADHVVLRVTSAHGIEADVQLWRVAGGWVLELVDAEGAHSTTDGTNDEQG